MISALPLFKSPVSKIFKLPGQQRTANLFIPFVSIGTLPPPGLHLRLKMARLASGLVVREC